MKDSCLKAVVFDLGNVLLDFDHTIAAKRISPFCAKGPEEIFDLFFDSPITGLFEEGKIKPADFFRQVKEMLGLRIAYEEFLPIWNEIFFFSDKNRALLELAVSLRGNYKLAVLSNINILHYDYIKGAFAVFEPFQEVFASCQMGLRKPDKEIYLRAVKILGVPLGETFYIDDRPELVESAKGLGIKAVVFRDLPGLASAFRQEGIDVN
jgi:putative hydrolase of the HAD superfamily